MGIFRGTPGLILRLLALAVLFCVSSARAEDCQKGVQDAEKKFKDLELPANEREAEAKCRYSRQTPRDRQTSANQKGFCVGSWLDMRTALDTYVKALGDSCRKATAQAAQCTTQGDSSSAAYLQCAADAAKAGQEANLSAKAILDRAMEHIRVAQEKALRHYEEYDGDTRFLDGSHQGEAWQGYLQRARDAGITDPQLYQRNARELSVEQQHIAQAATRFQEIATTESGNRRAAAETLGGIGARTADSHDKMSTISGTKDDPKKISDATMANAKAATAAAAAANKGKSDATAASSQAAAPAGSAPANTVGAAGTPSGQGGSAAGKTPKGLGSAPAPGSSETAKGTPTKALPSDSSVPGSNLDHSNVYLENQGGSLAGVRKRDANGKGLRASGFGSSDGSAMGRGQAGGRDPASKGEKSDSAKADGSLAEIGGGTFGSTGQLGPSQMTMDGPGELTADALMGITPLSVDGSPLTDEERKWLGLSPGDSVPDLKAARAELAARGESGDSHSAGSGGLGGSEVQSTGIAAPDSPGLFFRVKRTHLRAEKRGVVSRLPKRL